MGEVIQFKTAEQIKNDKNSYINMLQSLLKQKKIKFPTYEQFVTGKKHSNYWRTTMLDYLLVWSLDYDKFCVHSIGKGTENTIFTEFLFNVSVRFTRVNHDQAMLGVC